jgi:hypothetical protein
LEELSSVAGVAYVGAAMPFVRPLRRGAELLLGGSDNSKLEVGLSTTISQLQTGAYIVMRAPSGSVVVSDFKLNEAGDLIHKDGTSFKQYPYMVFSIEVSSKRESWFEISELRQAHEELRAAARKGDRSAARELLAMFRRIVLSSPDLLDEDAEKIVAAVEQRVKNVLGATTTAATDAGARDIGDLAELQIYPDGQSRPRRAPLRTVLPSAG